MKTAIVILNWNGRKLLEEFLPGIIRYSEHLAEIVVADNASSDTSIDFIRTHLPSVRIISNTVNEGFAKGYNTALLQVKSEYLLLLNSDVEVTKGWLEPLVNHLDTHPDTAVCQPKIKWYHHRNQFEYAGACGGYIDKLGYPFCRGRIFSELEEDAGQYDTPVPVFWASGACQLVRTKIFHEAGGFDGDFFAHMEEIDLCWRIKNMGHQIMCIPQSVVYHMGGATLPKNNSRKTFLNFRNNLSMLYKNLPANRVLSVIILRLLLDGVAGFKFLLEGGPGDCFAVFRAHWNFYFRILTGKLRRPKKYSGKNHHAIYPGSIIWDYYILKKKTFADLDFHPEKSE